VAVKVQQPKVQCSGCLHFRNDPAYLETVFKGLNILSSATASVRMDDGVCLRHDRYLSARASCADFEAANRDALAD
jgi:hypothetical protein